MNRVGDVQTCMVGPPAIDTVLDVCADKHRRIVLATLANQQSVSIDDLTNAIIEHNHHTSPAAAPAETVRDIRIELHHVHLPKLVEAGFIHYDPASQIVEPTAHVGRDASPLSTVLALDSELATL